MDPTIIVAIINFASILSSTIFRGLLRAQAVKNTQNAIVKANPAKTKNAESSSKQSKLNKAVESLERMMDSIDMEVKSFQGKINVIKAEELVLERMADEAISIFGNNVQVIMLFHGLGSIFLQLNHPHVGVHISVSFVVSFFSSFIVALVVTCNKTERLSRLDKDLQRRQRDIQNEVTYFETTVEMTYMDPKIQNLLAHNEAYGEALNGRMPLIKGNISTLQKSIAGILDSSFSKTNRIKAIFQVTVGATIYGFSFPMMAYYLLYFVDFRKKGFVNSMWK